MLFLIIYALPVPYTETVQVVNARHDIYDQWTNFWHVKEKSIFKQKTYVHIHASGS